MNFDDAFGRPAMETFLIENLEKRQITRFNNYIESFRTSFDDVLSDVLRDDCMIAILNKAILLFKEVVELFKKGKTAEYCQKYVREELIKIKERYTIYYDIEDVREEIIALEKEILAYEEELRLYPLGVARMPEGRVRRTVASYNKNVKRVRHLILRTVGNDIVVRGEKTEPYGNGNNGYKYRINVSLDLLTIDIFFYADVPNHLHKYLIKELGFYLDKGSYPPRYRNSESYREGILTDKKILEKICAFTGVNYEEYKRQYNRFYKNRDNGDKSINKTHNI